MIASRLLLVGWLLLPVVSAPLRAAEPVRVAFIPSGPVSVPFWRSADAGARDAATKAGVTLTIHSPVAAYAAGQQVEILHRVAATKPAAIVVAPVTVANECEPAVRQAIADCTAAGIKVVVFGLPALKGVDTAGVFIDQDAMAAAAAETVSAALAGGGELAVARMNSPDLISPRERAVVQLVRTQHPQAVVDFDVYVDHDDPTGLEQAKALLTKHPKTTVVFTPITPSTSAVQKALRELQLTGKVKHIGFGADLDQDAVAALESGALSALICQDPYTLGAKAVEAAASWTRSATNPGSAAVAFKVITKDNVGALKLARAGQ